MSDYAHPESLVDTQWVVDHLNDSQVRIVEVIWGASPAFGKAAYDSGHIPGAVAWEFEHDLQDPVRRDVLDKPELEALLSRSGITPETTIILYGGLNNMAATYAFWLLSVYGHKDLRLIDGGRQRWLDEDRPTTDQVPAIAPTSYQAQDPNWGLRASRDDVLELIGDENCVLLDARSAEMYSGVDKAGAARGGHVPGAVNLAARRETKPDGSFNAWRIPTVRPEWATLKGVK